MFSRNENGQGLVEYVLLLVLVAIVVIGALRLIAPELNNSFNKVINALTGISPVTYHYQITNLNVKRDDACKYELLLYVSTTDGDGNPASGIDVPIAVSLSSPAVFNTFTPSTNATGVAKVQHAVIYSHPGVCQHGTATINVADGTLSTTIGY